MYRFVTLFALVAVAFAEPEADPQYFYHHLGVPVVNPTVPVLKYNVPVVKPVVPVVKYFDPHHTEGMTKDGVPEKTDSVKVAEKNHEIAQIYEKNMKAVLPYGVPYAHHAYPYAHYPYAHYPYVPTVGAHVVAKREAEGESDPYVVYNTHHPYAGVTYAAGYPYTTAVAGYPYTSAVTGYHYQHPYYHTNVLTHAKPVVHAIGKREADSDAQYFYRNYAPYTYGHNYNYNYGHYPYTYGNRFAYGYGK